jgi:hypothetical protein
MNQGSIVGTAARSIQLLDGIFCVCLAEMEGGEGSA